MMGKITRLLAVLFLTMFLASPLNYISASGPITSSDNQPGQVILRRDGDSVYLSTQTAPGATPLPTPIVIDPAATPVGTPEPGLPAPRTGDTPLVTEDIMIPTGFATDVGTLINAVLSFVMVIAALLVFLYLIWGGIQWITSGGDKGKTEDARNKITAAILGLIVLAASYAVLLIALRFLGFANLTDVFENVRTIN
jgi:hypothetical protein